MHKPIKLVLAYNCIIVIFFIMLAFGSEGDDFWEKINGGLLVNIFKLLCLLAEILYMWLVLTPVGTIIIISASFYFGILIIKYAPKSNDWIYIIKNIIEFIVLTYISAFVSVLEMEDMQLSGIKMLYHSYILFYMKLNIIPMLIGIVSGYIWRRLTD